MTGDLEKKVFEPSPLRTTQQAAASVQAMPGFNIPLSLLILKQQVANELTSCRILVGMAALAGGLASIIIGEYSLGMIGLFLEGFGDMLNSAGSANIGFLPLLSGLFNMVLGIVLGLVAPVCIVLLAVFDYNRTYRLTVSDLVWGEMAHFFIQDEYGLLIEQARIERFRLNPNPVELGETLGQRLQHFAAYYTQYRRLAKPIGEVKLPTVIERNCWADGALLGVGACLSVCCLGLVLVMPMIIRIAGGWPRQLAIKQAVIHFFEGRFDQSLETQWQKQHAGNPSESNA